MADPLTLRTTENADMAISSLGEEDRRRVTAWFDHLRNWRTDPIIRGRAVPVPSEEGGVFLFPTSTDLWMAVQVGGTEITVLAVFRAGSVPATAGRQS